MNLTELNIILASSHKDDWLWHDGPQQFIYKLDLSLRMKLEPLLRENDYVKIESYLEPFFKRFDHPKADYSIATVYYNNSFVLEKLFIAADQSRIYIAGFSPISKDAPIEDIVQVIVDAKKQKPIHYVLSSQDVNFGYLLTRRYTKEKYIAQLKIAKIEIDELEPSTL